MDTDHLSLPSPLCPRTFLSMTSPNDNMVLSTTNEIREHEETVSISMSFRAQRYDPSWRSRPPCARGGDPPESPQDADDPCPEMARKIEAIASAVAKKQRHDRNHKVSMSVLLQWMPIHMGWQQGQGLCCVYQKDKVQDRKQHEENAKLDCQKSRLWVRLLVSLEQQLTRLKTSAQNPIMYSSIFCFHCKGKSLHILFLFFNNDTPSTYPTELKLINPCCSNTGQCILIDSFCGW